MNTLRRSLWLLALAVLAFPAKSAEADKLSLQLIISSKTKAPDGANESRFYRNKLLLDFNTTKTSVFPREYEISLKSTDQGKNVLLEVQLRDVQSATVEVGSGKILVPLGGQATLELPAFGATKYSVQFKAERVSAATK